MITVKNLRHQTINKTAIISFRLSKAFLLFSFSMTSLLPYNYSKASSQNLECYQESDFIDSGYNLGSKKLELLSKSFWIETSLNISYDDILDKIHEYAQIYNPAVTDEVSFSILQASIATGIDPFIFTSLVKKESVFKSNAKSPTGALGLTQLTTVALNEIRHQMGLDLKAHANPSAKAALTQMALEYFEQDTEKFNQWVTWLSKTTLKSAREELHTNNDYALLTGALLFKIYISLNNGNYLSSLKAYNGSKIKNQYAKDVLKTKDKIEKVNLICLDLSEEKNILKSTCELTQDFKICAKAHGYIAL